MVARSIRWRHAPIAVAGIFLSLCIAFAPDVVPAQEPAPRADPAVPDQVTFVVRDAATGLPLDAVQVVRSATGLPSAVVVRGDATGRVTLIVSALAADGADIALAFNRIGYAPRTITLAELLAHAAEHIAETHDLLLTPRPALLSAISVEVPAPNQLATGTALAVSTAAPAAMRERAMTSLAESLEGIEGVTTSRTGAWGSKLSVRGLGGERLAFMVDGARVNRACTFGMDQGLATVDPANVERVEILAGPGSTLYGSGNVGGVVNVVTRNPALAAPDGQVGGEVRIGASSAIPGGSIGVGAWTRRGRFDVALQLDAQRYGDYRTPTMRVEGSSYRSGTLDLKAGYDLAAAQRLAFQYTEYAARDIGWPSMAGGLIPREGRRTLALDWGWQRGRGLVDAAGMRAYVQRLDHHMLMDMVMPMEGMGGMPMTMRSTTDARSYSTTSGARAQIRLRPDGATHVDAGVEAVRWAAEGTRWVTQGTSGAMDPVTTTYHTWPDVRILDVGVFAQGERAFRDRLTVSGGARADRIEKRADGWSPESDVVATGNLGARLQVGAGFGLRTSAGLGYRVPDPTELFGTVVRPDGYLYRGNPELTTETGRTVEAGVTWDGALHSIGVHEASFGLTVFRNDLSDLIMPMLAADAMPDGPQVREYVNVAEARLSGATTSVLVDIAPAFRLRGSATYIRGDDRTSGVHLAAVPPLTGTLALRLAPDDQTGALPRMAAARAWVEVEGRAAVRQDRAATGAGELVTPAWTVMTLRAGTDLAGASVSMSVDNLFDRTYREHLDPASLLRPGRNFSLRITQAF